MIIPDGAAFAAAAFLQSAGASRRQLWRGVLTADDQRKLWQISWARSRRSVSA